MAISLRSSATSAAQVVTKSSRFKPVTVEIAKKVLPSASAAFLRASIASSVPGMSHLFATTI